MSDAFTALARQAAQTHAQLWLAANMLESATLTAAPGWLGADLRTFSTEPAMPSAPTESGTYIRIGHVEPAGLAAVPFTVPFLGFGHIAVASGPGDPLTASLLRMVVARTVAAVEPGGVTVCLVDARDLGAPLSALTPLTEVGLYTCATEPDGLRAHLAKAEDQIRRVHAKETAGSPYLLIAIAGVAFDRMSQELDRIRAIARAGPACGVHLLVSGFPPTPRPWEPAEEPLANTTHLFADDNWLWLGVPPHLCGVNAAVPVCPDPAVSDHVLRLIANSVTAARMHQDQVSVSDVLPKTDWTESSADGLKAVVGRAGTDSVELSFDDVTAHWLVGGRNGTGKTVFLLDLLYGLAARYSPDELEMYLLDLKAGLGFQQLAPSLRDPSWLPHIRVIGLEADRDYALAVLRELTTELTRRADLMKSVGAHSPGEYRQAHTSNPSAAVRFPRKLVVIDEFQEIFAYQDQLSVEAKTLLNGLARKARQPGIHLVLATQRLDGIPALYDLQEAMFSQFALRIALRGDRSVLHHTNFSDDSLPVGKLVANNDVGKPGRNRVVSFPNADDDHERKLLDQVRHRLTARGHGRTPPKVFISSQSPSLGEDPVYLSLEPSENPTAALVGWNIDVDLTTARFDLETVPGRNLAVLGTQRSAAQSLAAAVLSVARQYRPGRARFVLAPFAETHMAQHIADLLKQGQHEVCLLGHDELGRELASLATADRSDVHTFIVPFALDAVGEYLDAGGHETTPGDDLRRVVVAGPPRGVHVLGWWRTVHRFHADISRNGRLPAPQYVAGVIAHNVAASDLYDYLGHSTPWVHEQHRALFIDTATNIRAVILPFQLTQEG